MADHSELVSELRQLSLDYGEQDELNTILYLAANAIEEMAAEREEAVGKIVRTFTYKGITLKEWADRYLNPKTNGDRIRSMSDKELAEWMGKNAGCAYCQIEQHCRDGVEVHCGGVWLKWLESLAKGEQE